MHKGMLLVCCGSSYHGMQVTPGVCLDQTIAAICEASQYPLSIVMVGVGDGPWDKCACFMLRARERTAPVFKVYTIGVGIETLGSCLPVSASC